MFRRRIRKDAGDITVDDLLAHPSWEFCLDEEGDDEQTECTMRPFKPRNGIINPKDYCCVAATIRFGSEREFVGWFSLNGGSWESPWMLATEVFLPDISTDFQNDPRLSPVGGVIRYLPPNRTRISLSLSDPKHQLDDDARDEILLAYELMELKREGAFPAKVMPLQVINGWPASWEIPGFLRRPRGTPFNIVQ